MQYLLYVTLFFYFIIAAEGDRWISSLLKFDFELSFAFQLKMLEPDFLIQTLKLEARLRFCYIAYLVTGQRTSAWARECSNLTACTPLALSQDLLAALNHQAVAGAVADGAALEVVGGSGGAEVGVDAADTLGDDGVTLGVEGDVETGGGSNLQDVGAVLEAGGHGVGDDEGLGVGDVGKLAVGVVNLHAEYAVAAHRYLLALHGVGAGAVGGIGLRGGGGAYGVVEVGGAVLTVEVPVHAVVANLVELPVHEEFLTYVGGFEHGEVGVLTHVVLLDAVIKEEDVAGLVGHGVHELLEVGDALLVGGVATHGHLHVVVAVVAYQAYALRFGSGIIVLFIGGHHFVVVVPEAVGLKELPEIGLAHLGASLGKAEIVIIIIGGAGHAAALREGVGAEFVVETAHEAGHVAHHFEVEVELVEEVVGRVEGGVIVRLGIAAVIKP